MKFRESCASGGYFAHNAGSGRASTLRNNVGTHVYRQTGIVLTFLEIDFLRHSVALTMLRTPNRIKFDPECLKQSRQPLSNYLFPLRQLGSRIMKGEMQNGAETNQEGTK